MKSIARTDIGLVRSSNQDMAFASDTAVGLLPNLYLVADGMGGQLAGEFASCYTVQEFVRQLEQQAANHADPLQLMANAAMEVNDGLYQESGKEGPHRGTGTTLVAASVTGSVLYAINIGDSRLYRIGRQIEQVTQDHSYAEELVRLGQVERGTEEYFNNKHIITRAIGPWESIRVDTFSLALDPEDVILLCSDGLCGMVSDARILEIIGQFRPFSAQTLPECADALIEEAKKSGGTDNITVVLAVPDFS